MNKKPGKELCHDKPCQDHHGNNYPSIKDMCKAYNINPESFTQRIRVYHMPLEEALIRPVKHNGGILIIMVWQSHLSGKFRAIVPVAQSHFDFA